MNTVEPIWHKSSLSSSNGGECVEVAGNVPGRVLVRDSKDRGSGALIFGPAAWQSFIAEVSAKH